MLDFCEKTRLKTAYMHECMRWYIHTHPAGASRVLLVSLKSVTVLLRNVTRLLRKKRRTAANVTL